MKNRTFKKEEKKMNEMNPSERLFDPNWMHLMFVIIQIEKILFRWNETENKNRKTNIVSIKAEKYMRINYQHLDEYNHISK